MAMKGCHVHASDEEEEEELVDPMDALKQGCSETEKCAALEQKLQQCNNRVNSRENTEETCMEELIDFVHCVDHCVAKDLFQHLK